MEEGLAGQIETKTGLGLNLTRASTGVEDKRGRPGVLCSCEDEGEEEDELSEIGDASEPGHQRAEAVTLCLGGRPEGGAFGSRGLARSSRSGSSC